MKYDVILFDIDGTMLDTEYAVLHGFQKALNTVKHIDVPLTELKFSFGIPGEVAVKKFSNDPEECAQIFQLWGKTEHELRNHITVFPGIKDTLTGLKERQLKLAIVTSQTTAELQRNFEPFGLNHFFDLSITATDTQKHKPDPEPILKAKEILGSEFKYLYIGDALYDLRCAHSAKTDFALAMWGANLENDFSQAEYLLKHPADIFNCLN